MKEYPSIPHYSEVDLFGKECISQNKHDGSNLRIFYSRKQKKWCKFGTRRHLFAESDPDYGAALPVFFAKYAEGLEKVFHDNKSWRVSEHLIAYVEYFGPSSFAGQHVREEPKDVVLFDVDIHRRGILGPEEFQSSFGHLPVVETIYKGILTDEFVQDVREGKYNVNEGVICKFGSGHKLQTCKIKTLAYLQKLKEKFAERWKEYE